LPGRCSGALSHTFVVLALACEPSDWAYEPFELDRRRHLQGRAFGRSLGKEAAEGASDISEAWRFVSNAQGILKSVGMEGVSATPS